MKTNREGKGDLRRVAELLQELRDVGELAEAERRELNDLLRRSEENRSFAAQHLLDGESLKDLLAAGEMKVLASGAPERVRETRQRTGFRGRLLPFLAMAASLAIAGFLGFAWMKSAPIAVILDEAEAVFEDEPLPEDGVLKRKPYTLIGGVISIEFRNGVTMTVDSPAKFEVVDDFRMKLNQGRIRAFAPESGQGFVVETPDADIEDLGTEFGVSVGEDSGESQVHVFDGRVDVKRKGSRDLIASLLLGDSARIHKGEVKPGTMPGPGEYLTLADVSRARWEKLSGRVNKDEDLVFHFRFNQDEANDRVLRDEAFHGEAVDGAITGARWVTGRWPGKRALLFDEENDSVIVEVPGELPQFTFAAWVNLDRLDNVHTAIFNSIGFSEGDVHLQVTRGRRNFSAGVYPKSHHSDTGIQMPVGRWTLLVAVVDAEEKKASTWINGKLAVETHFDEVPLIRPGTCLIGSSAPGVVGVSSRSFHGRMDEAILWRRVLTKKEIWRLYFKGTPYMRPNKDS